MSSTSTVRRANIPAAVRNWIFGGVALAWYAVSTFGPLDLPAFAVVIVLGVLVMLSVEPDGRHRHRGVAATRRNLVLAVLTTVAFVPVALGSDLLIGRVPVESVPLVLGALAAVCVAILPPRRPLRYR